MAEKHYQCKNAENPVQVGKIKFQFGPTHWNDATRTYWGIYSTDKKDEQSALDTAVSQGKVFPLSDSEALTYIEKKTTLGSHKSVIDSELQQRLLRNKPSAEVVEDEEDFQAEDAVDMSTLVAEEKGEVDEPAEKAKPEKQSEEKPKRKRGRPPKKPLTDGE